VSDSGFSPLYSLRGGVLVTSTVFKRFWREGGAPDRRIRIAALADIPKLEARRWRVSQYARLHWRRAPRIIDALVAVGGVGYCRKRDGAGLAWAQVLTSQSADMFADPRGGKVVPAWSWNWCEDGKEGYVPIPMEPCPGDAAATALMRHWERGVSLNGKKALFDNVLDTVLRARVEHPVADRQYRFDINGRVYWYAGSRAGVFGWARNTLVQISWPDDVVESVSVVDRV